MELDAKLRFGHEPMPEKAPKFKMAGKAYEFVLNFADVVVVDREPNQYDYITPSIGKNFIKRVYTWNKNALKNAVQNGNEEIAKLAAIEKKPWIKINPKI